MNFSKSSLGWQYNELKINSQQESSNSRVVSSERENCSAAKLFTFTTSAFFYALVDKIL